MILNNIRDLTSTISHIIQNITLNLCIKQLFITQIGGSNTSSLTESIKKILK